MKLNTCLGLLVGETKENKKPEDFKSDLCSKCKSNDWNKTGQDENYVWFSCNKCKHEYGISHNSLEMFYK